MDETVVFSMDDHWQKVGDTMWQFYTDGQMVDININCHGHSVWAHKVVLAMFSPILRASLMNSTTMDVNNLSSDGPIKSLNLDEVAEEGSDVEYLMEFMYRGHVAVPRDRVDSVLCTAEMLEMRDMVEAMRSSTNNYDSLHGDDNGLLVKRQISTSQDIDTETNGQYEEVVVEEEDGEDIELSLDTNYGQETNGESFVEEEGNAGIRQGTRQRTSTRFYVDQELDSESRRKFKCTYCGKLFWSERGYDTHIQIHSDHAENKHKCPACDFSTVTRWSLLKHMAVVHRIDGDGNHLSETIVCEHCDFTCSTENQLNQHVLRKHSASDATMEEFDEDELGNIFKKEKNAIECATCGYQCQTHVALHWHAQTHLGAKAYKCPICGVEYADRGKYRAHVLRHADDEKKFVCRICNHGCHRKDNLRRHLQAVHNEILDDEKGPVKDKANYACHMCNYRCNLKENLILHLRKSHNKPDPVSNERKVRRKGKGPVRPRVRDDKSFNCHVCKKTIRRKDNFRVHLRTLHGISLEELLGSSEQPPSKVSSSAQSSVGGRRRVSQPVTSDRSRANSNTRQSTVPPAITIINIATK